MSAVSSVSTPGRVRHQDATVASGIEIDVVDAGAEVGDEPEARAGLRQHRAIDAVGDRRHQDVGGFDGLDELSLSQRFVFDIQARIEKLAHPSFDDVRKLACDDDNRFLLGGRHSLPVARKTRRSHLDRGAA